MSYFRDETNSRYSRDVPTVNVFVCDACQHHLFIDADKAKAKWPEFETNPWQATMSALAAEGWRKAYNNNKDLLFCARCWSAPKYEADYKTITDAAPIELPAPPSNGARELDL